MHVFFIPQMEIKIILATIFILTVNAFESTSIAFWQMNQTVLNQIRFCREGLLTMSTTVISHSKVHLQMTVKILNLSVMYSLPS